MVFNAVQEQVQNNINIFCAFYVLFYEFLFTSQFLIHGRRGQANIIFPGVQACIKNRMFSTALHSGVE